MQELPTHLIKHIAMLPLGVLRVVFVHLCWHCMGLDPQLKLLWSILIICKWMRGGVLLHVSGTGLVPALSNMIITHCFANNESSHAPATQFPYE